MIEPASSETPPATSSSSEARAKALRSSKLGILLALGVILIGIALAFRFSPWGREFQLQRASLELLRRQAREAPRDPLLYYYLGTKAYNAHSLAEAGYCFQNATGLDPKMARAYVGLALVQQDLGQFPEAYDSLKHALAISPHDADTQFLLAMVVMNNSRARASEEFRKVTQLDPHRADAWYWLGVCQDEINQRAEALTALRKAVALQPKNATYRRDLGKVLLETNFFAEARTELEQALRLNRVDSQTCYLMGMALLKLAQSDSDLKQAGQMFASAETLVPTSAEERKRDLAEIIGARAKVATRLHRPSEALAYLERARATYPRNISFIYDEGAVQRMLGNEAEASRLMTLYTRLSVDLNEVSQLSQRIKQDPKDATLRLRLARVFARAKDYPRALNQYAYCLYLAPEQPDARREMAALKQQLGVKGEAPAPLDPALEFGPQTGAGSSR